MLGPGQPGLQATDAGNGIGRCNRHVFRAAQIEIGKCAHHAERHDAIGNIKRRRAVRIAQKLAGHRIGNLLAEFAVANVAVARLQPAFAHRLQQALVATAGGRQLHAAGDRSDARVAEIEQIAGCLPAGGDIVDGNGVDILMVDGAAEQDDGTADRKIAPAVIAVRAHGHDNRAIAPDLADTLERTLLGIRLFIAVEDDEGIAPGGNGRLGRANDARIEGIGEVGDHQRQELGTTPSQVAGDLRRFVAQHVDRPHHPQL